VQPTKEPQPANSTLQHTQAQSANSTPSHMQVQPANSTPTNIQVQPANSTQQQQLGASSPHHFGSSGSRSDVTGLQGLSVKQQESHPSKRKNSEGSSRSEPKLNIKTQKLLYTTYICTTTIT